MAEKICWRETNSFSIFMCLYAQIYLKFRFISKPIIYFLYENITTKKCFVCSKRLSRGMSEEHIFIYITRYYMNDIVNIYIRTLRIILWYILVLFWGCFDLMIYCFFVWIRFFKLPFAKYEYFHFIFLLLYNSSIFMSKTFRLCFISSYYIG